MADMAVRLASLGQSKTVALGIFLIAIGLFIKMGLFPFHGWLPDAYTYASNSASSFIAPIMTKVSIYALARIFYHSLGVELLQDLGLLFVLKILGSIAIIVGSILAFRQTDLKRMLAYSSISQIGLIILALSLEQKEAYIGAVLHMVNHAIMKGLLFLIAASAFHQHGILDIFKLSSLRGKMPYTLAALSIAALSMIGIPPFCGFFSKWYILVGALKSGSGFAVSIIILSSLLTALYFFKVLEQAFYQKDTNNEGINEAPLSLTLATGSLSISLLILGLYSSSIYQWGEKILTPLGALIWK